MPLAPLASAHEHARLLLRHERFAESLPLLRWALARDGAGAPRHQAAVRALLATGQAEQAEALLFGSVEAAPRDVVLRALLTAALWAHGALAEALGELALLTTHHPGEVELTCHRARLLSTLGREREALTHLRAFRAAHATTPDALHLEATLCEAAHPPDVTGAAEAWHAAAALDTGDWRAPWRLGRLERAAPERAQAHLEEAVRRAPRQPEPHLALAHLLARGGEPGQARAAAMRAFTLATPDRAAMRQEAAMVLIALAPPATPRA